LKFIENATGTLSLFDVSRGHFEDESVMVERVRLILNVHSLWISNHQNNRRALNHGLTPREIIDHRLSASYKWTRFLTDNRRICGLKRDLVGDEGTGCDVERCAVIGRNGRNRAFYGSNDSMRNKLYFVESEDEEEAARNMATQQILDSLHSYFYHTVHLSDGERKETMEQDESDDDDINFETLCDDHSTEKLVNLMEQKRSESNRFRSRTRKRGSVSANDNEPQHSENQKFMTTNDFEAASNSTFSAVYSTRRQRCFRDVFVAEMERHGVSKEAVQTLEFDDAHCRRWRRRWRRCRRSKEVQRNGEAVDFGAERQGRTVLARSTLLLLGEIPRE